MWEWRGSRWDGLPTFAVVLADVLVGFWVVGVAFAILASIRVRICICWLSTDRWWVLTALDGVSRLFSFLDLRWCEGMVDDGGGDEERRSV